MKFLIVLFIICCIFPSVGTCLGNGLITLVPVAEAFMPCLIMGVGLYLLVKSVFKQKEIIMNSNNYSYVDPNTGNVYWNGPLSLQKGNH